jgi:hypothetical protein
VKTVSDALLALINSTIASDMSASGAPVNFQDFDCYTLTLASGTVLRFTNADFDITDAIVTTGTGYYTAEDGVSIYTAPDGISAYVVEGGSVSTAGSHVWTSALRVDEAGSKTLAHWKAGFDADQWTLIVMPRPVDPVTNQVFPDTIGGVPWILAAQGGALDAADFQVDRAVFETMPTWPIPPGGAAPVGFITGIFAGVVGAVDTTSTQVIITVQDYRQLLSIQMPRHFWQGQCRHTLFDIGCTANFTTLPKASFATNGAAIGGSTPGSIENNLPVPAGSKTYVQGSITMTSGQNAGFSRTITGWAGAAKALKLLIPFPFAIVSGDTFTAYPGCAKTQAACAAFNNSDNFGGQSYVPTPETAA